MKTMMGVQIILFQIPISISGNSVPILLSDGNTGRVQLFIWYGRREEQAPIQMGRFHMEMI